MRTDSRSTASSVALVLFAGCGGTPLAKCEVVDASVDPSVFVAGEDETIMTVVAETASCDPENDRISIFAVVEDTFSFSIAALADSGRDGDPTAGDGVYERPMANPFYGGSPVGEAIIRFSPCDPNCRGPSVEIPIRVDPAPPAP